MCLNTRYTVVLNGRETIRDALMKHSVAFSDRPQHFTTNALYLNINAKGKVLFGVFNSSKFEHF